MISSNMIPTSKPEASVEEVGEDTSRRAVAPHLRRLPSLMSSQGHRYMNQCGRRSRQPWRTTAYGSRLQCRRQSSRKSGQRQSAAAMFACICNMHNNTSWIFLNRWVGLGDRAEDVRCSSPQSFAKRSCPTCFTTNTPLYFHDGFAFGREPVK
jgi:hypothetical protein